MFRKCPYCADESSSLSDRRTVASFGTFHRTSDGRDIRRFRCLLCKKTFSHASFDVCFRQKKRNKNPYIKSQLCSGVSLRRTAREGHLSRTTIARRVKFFGKIAKEELHADNLAAEKVFELEFDDMETFEHTKCKPLSVTLAVESETRRILGFQVARMPAKGPLSEKARRKYGYRNDERAERRRQLFESIQPFVAERALIKSDSNPNYPKDVKAYFPTCVHQPYLGKRGAITGQGELKKTRFDPLFSLNHTCAMFRANISRLIRKTWNTTKDPERLADHIAIYCVYHNAHLN